MASCLARSGLHNGSPSMQPLRAPSVVTLAPPASAAPVADAPASTARCRLHAFQSNTLPTASLGAAVSASSGLHQGQTPAHHLCRLLAIPSAVAAVFPYRRRSLHRSRTKGLHSFVGAAVASGVVGVCGPPRLGLRLPRRVAASTRESSSADTSDADGEEEAGEAARGRRRAKLSTGLPSLRVQRPHGGVAAGEAPADAATPGGSAAEAGPGSAAGADLASLKVTELQTALQALGLPRSGRKAELLERLMAARAAQATAAATAASSAQSGPADGPSTRGSAAASPRPGSAAAATAKPVAGTPPATAAATSAAATGPSSSGSSSSSRSTSGGTTARRILRTKRSTDETGAGTPGGAGTPTAETASLKDDPLDDLFGALDVNITVMSRGSERFATSYNTRGAHAATSPEPRNPLEAGDGDGPVGPDLRRRRMLYHSVDSVDTEESWLAGEDPDFSMAPDPRRRLSASGAGGSDGGADAGGGKRGLRQSGTGDAAGQAAGPAAEAPPFVDSGTLPPFPEVYMGHLRFPEEMAPRDREAQDELVLNNRAGLVLTSLGSAVGGSSTVAGLACLALYRGKDIYIFDAGGARRRPKRLWPRRVRRGTGVGSLGSGRPVVQWAKKGVTSRNWELPVPPRGFGDDTQRQLARTFHIKPSKVYRIFLTSLAPECVLGLPGMLCTVNSSRERGHELADIPVHVYGPPGTADFLATVMRVSQTLLDITTIVHEIVTGPVAPEDAEPHLFASRSRIWRSLMPPDQLNPAGGTDASLTLFAPDMGRGTKTKGRNAPGGVLSHDPRAGFLPWPPFKPGDPRRRDLDPMSYTWTLNLDVTARVVINLLPGPPGGPHPYTLSYTVMEAKRAGYLSVERAVAAGVIPGKDFATLKEGKPVLNSLGQLVDPTLVVSPTRPGRRVVVLGTSPDPAALADVADSEGPDGQPHLRGADLLVAGAVYPKGDRDRAAKMGGCMSDVLGKAARRLGIRHVMLTRFDSRRFLLGGSSPWTTKSSSIVKSRDGAKVGKKDPSGVEDGDKGGGVAGGEEEGDDGNDGSGNLHGYRADEDDGGYAARVAAEVAVAAYGSRKAATGGGGDGGRPLRVAVLEDLESVFLEKNEGPQERRGEEA